MGTDFGVNVEKWLSFYRPYFESEQQANDFVSALERLDADHPSHSAKIMMHQVQRLVSLANDIPQIRPGNETLPLLFLLVCAEHIAKLHHKYQGEGQSRSYVRRFFEEFLTEEDETLIRSGITSWERRPLPLREAIDILYTVRCDLVHEGRYWGFHFRNGGTSMINGDPDVVVNLKLHELTDIVVRSAIRSIQTFDPQP
jgi:hypothetical protein